MRFKIVSGGQTGVVRCQKTHPFIASRMTEIKNKPIKQGMRAIRPRFGCIDFHV